MSADISAAAIRRILLQDLNIDAPADGADLVDSGLLDSLALVELIYQLEQQFHIHIDLEQLEMDDLRTLEGIAGFVASRVDGA